LSGAATKVEATVAGTASAELVRGNMGDNDQARILVGATATNAGFLEIATADDGTEPIFVRQYTGVFASIARTLTLLDGSGNTALPGSLSVNASGTATAISNGGTNGVGNIGASGAGFNTIFAKATSAQYADLAENYETDDDYAVGTVVMVGGNREVTTSSFGKRAIGVVSENPAYLMNSTGKGQPIALKGKVKVRVKGFIAKGDELMADNNGTARRVDANFKDKVFAIALENNADSDAINLIECIVL
jgi:hypothetical protein